MDIYWVSGSPYAWRIFLALEFKGVPYNSKLLSMDQGDAKKPEYLKINPRGMVPALVDGDFKIAESIAMMSYIESKFPDKSLMGKTAEEKARVLQDMSETMCYFEPHFRQFAGPVMFNKIQGKEESIKEAVEKLHTELVRLEEKRKANPFATGKEITAADFWLFPFLTLLERAAGKPQAKGLDLKFLPLAKTYPSVSAWMEKIKALPGYDRTYPPHWREQDKAA